MSDVCLILEGTYPFVSGGVSTWIHQLVGAMPDLRFSIVYISPYPNPHREYKYKIPPNVVDIQDLYLHEVEKDEKPSPRDMRRAGFAALDKVHEDFIAGSGESFVEGLRWFRGPEGTLNGHDLFRSREAWELFTALYARHGEGVSFLDFFWTFRSIYIPLLKTVRAPLPKARLYHTVSTGYAGILAATAKALHGTPVLLTEHGVYSHERLLEISQSTWIYSPQRERFRVQRELSFFKRVWLGFFGVMGRITYRHADRIITLYEGNRAKQIVAGAPGEKISIIPNGIDISHYRDIPLKREGEGRRTVAFIGRIVPIKDVKTFLQAAGTVLKTLPDARFLVVGPTDEEPEYTHECRQMSLQLGIEKNVEFMGKRDMEEIYPQVDVVVLTSLSEAQPYVILEASAIGIPAVATDVGACRELLEGRSPEDKKIGPSGLLTGVSRPEETAAGVVRLLTDPRLWKSMSEAGRNRTMRFYDQSDLVSKYLNLYEQMMH